MENRGALRGINFARFNEERSEGVLVEPKVTKKRHFRILVGLLVLELTLLGNLWVNRHHPASVVLGFLIKSGSHYTVAWKLDTRDYETRSYETLPEALSFMHQDLKLSEGRNPLPEHELEHAWLNNRFGNYVVLWKTLKYSFVNQLTFQNSDDAKFFLDAFRHGAYAPSIFGHSILFVPRTSMLN